jgi:hypothetical protein
MNTALANAKRENAPMGGKPPYQIDLFPEYTSCKKGVSNSFKM